MNLTAERQTITADELRAAFKASRLKFTKGYGLLTALQKPLVRWSLEMQALAMRGKKTTATRQTCAGAAGIEQGEMMNNESRIPQASNEARILKIIAESSSVNESCIELTHSIVTDLHCDSLDRAGIMVELEVQFDIEIDEDDFAKCVTVQQAIDYVADVCTRKNSPATSCVSHHHACECREQKIATFNKASLDAAMELDWLKNEFDIPEDKLDAITLTSSRVYTASAALYPQEDPIEQMRRLIVTETEVTA